MPRLTVAQALVTFLARRWSERDGVRRRLIPACFGIFGHGNVGIGEALAGDAGVDLPYHLCRTEQGMVHTAAAYARSYSCTGYEIAGGIGVKLAAPDREVLVLVGDGSYLMLPSELVTATATVPAARSPSTWGPTRRASARS